MIEIFRKKFGLRMREVYFASMLSPSNVARDLDIYVQHGSLLPGGKPFWTVCLDLLADESYLFLNIAKNYRYEINRAAQKDGLICSINFSPSVQDIKAFINFYNDFARYRGLHLGNCPKLCAFRDSGNVILAEVKSVSDKRTLVMHCYIADSNRVRLYHSGTVPKREGVNETRQLIGRANKLLHWEAIKEMKRAGIASYDFGGIAKSENLKGVDDFKLHFGGVVRQESNAVIAVSRLGRLALHIKKIVEQVRGKK